MPRARHFNVKDIISKIKVLITSKTAKSTYVLFTGNTTDAFLAFLFTVITFRLLDTADFGIFSAINNFVVLAFSILDMGIGSGLINFISYNFEQNKRSLARDYLFSGIIIRAITSGLFALLVIVFSPLIASKFFLTNQYTAVILAGISILGLSIIDVTTFALQGYQKFFKSAITSSSFSFLRFIFILLIILTKNPLSITLAVLITTTASLLGAIIGLKFLNISFSNFTFPKRSVHKSLLSFAGWIAVNKIASSVAGKVDTQMLLLLAGPVVTGIYSVSSRIASFYAVIITSFAAVVAPKLASGKTLLELKPFLQKALLAVVGLLALMVIGLLIAEPFIILLFGQKAAPSVAPFQGLTLAYMPFVASSLAIIIIIYNLKKTFVVGLLSLVQVLIIVIGNLILIPRKGIYGPVIALGLANVVTMLMAYVYILTHLNKHRAR